MHKILLLGPKLTINKKSTIFPYCHETRPILPTHRYAKLATFHEYMAKIVDFFQWSHLGPGANHNLCKQVLTVLSE